VAKKVKSGHLDTLIGTNTVLEGNIESEGTVRVDGKLHGDLKAGGDVFVGPGAAITGSIYASNVVLSGNLIGNVYADGILRLLSQGRLRGNVQVHGFVADEGGVFHGKCNIIEERQQVVRESTASADGEEPEKGGFRSRAALRRAKENGEAAGD
jgi:cytoskeletal protein CcmA (bactofilin family)